VLRCSGVMSRKHSRTSIAYRSPKQSDRARDGRGVETPLLVINAAYRSRGRGALTTSHRRVFQAALSRRRVIEARATTHN